jgi:phosphoglycerate dehydrogenase-like enzyme
MIRQPRTWIGPEPDQQMIDAVIDGGGVPTDNLETAEAVVWVEPSTSRFPNPLPDSVRWVQLPSAGVERWFDSGILDDRRAWTSAAGAYGFTVAEHALALILAGLRRIPDAARARSWQPLTGRELRRSEVAIVGAGGVGKALIGLLEPFDTTITAVNRSGQPAPGACRTLAAADLDTVWDAADVIVIGAPATTGTRHLVGERELKSMRSHALLVNIARGALVDTEALTTALRDGWIGGAALDVVDPEPLPEEHPLWTEPRAVITPHAANPGPALRRELAHRVRENVTRFAIGQPLLAPIDPRIGY